MAAILDNRYFMSKVPFQVNRCVHLVAPTTLQRHAHTFGELTLVRQGEAIHHVWLPGGRHIAYPLCPGSAFLVREGEEHTFELLSQPFLVYNVLFDSAVGHHAPCAPGGGVPRDFLPGLPWEVRYPAEPIKDALTNERIDASIVALERELAHGEDAACEACLLHFLLLSHTVARYFDRSTEAVHYNGPAHVLRLVEYLQQHSCDEALPSLEELAARSGYSVRSLTAHFRQCTGMSIVQFIQRQRVEKAGYFLCHTDMNITEIALSSGFNNLPYFNKVFRAHTGLPPTAYRQKNRQNG